MTPVFYKTVLEQNPALRRAEVREAAALEQIGGVAAAVPAAHAGIYALAMQKVKAAQQELRELATEQQAPVELAEESTAVMSDMVALPVEASQGESLVLAQASQTSREAPASKSKSKSADSSEDEDNNFGLLMGGFLGLGLAVAKGGGSSSPASAPEACDHDTDFNLPARPSSASALSVNVAQGDDEIQASGASGLEYTSGHTALLITVGDHANLHAETFASGIYSGAIADPFLINASGDIGAIHFSAGVSARSSVEVNAAGQVGDVVIKVNADTREFRGGDTINYLSISAGGDVGNIYFLNSGGEAGGGFYSSGDNFGFVENNMGVDAFGGDVGNVNVQLTGPSGGGFLYVSAYASAGVDGLVGGDVGDVKFNMVGPETSGNVYVRASGGDVGNLTLTAVGGSASGDLYVSALAQVDASGNAVGGNVGDITLDAHGPSAHGDISAVTRGALGDGGVYLGGGNVGDIVVELCEEDSAKGDAKVRVYTYDGGSVGNVSVTSSNGSGSAKASIEAYGVVNDAGEYDGGGNIGNVTVFGRGGSGEASAIVYGYSGGSIGNLEVIASGSYSAQAVGNAKVYGAGGHVSTIGDVTIDVYENLDNSGKVYLDAFSGGDIGNITANVYGGVSGHVTIEASAYANVNGSGGSLGDVTVINRSFNGDTEIQLYADTLIGDVTITTGAGGADARVEIGAGSGATVGDVSVTLDAAHYESGGYLNLNISSGATMGDFTLDGGSEYSTFEVSGGSSVSVGHIDASGYLGFVGIDLAGVQTGTRIDSGQGQSWIAGTEGSDDIYLGDGDDTIYFGYFNSGEGVDDIYDYEAGVDELDVYDQGVTDFVDLVGNTMTTIADGSVVSLVDLAGGDDLSTAAGLEDALNGGEYGLIDFRGGMCTFVTASSNASDSFNVFLVLHNGSAYEGTYLMATVDFKTGSTFGDLTASDFV